MSDSHAELNVAVEEKYCHSKTGRVTNGFFTWTIEDFEHLSQPPGTEVRSGPFSCGDTKWRLSLRPNGIHKSCKHIVNLYLNHLESLADAEVVEKTIYILNGLNNRFKLEEPRLFGDPDYRKDDWGFHTECRRATILGSSRNGNASLLDNGNLKVGIELTISLDLDIPYKKSFLSDYSDFFNNGTVSDVQIIHENGKSIPAHKIILMKNSTYFAGMFSHPMEENLKGKVLAKKISPQALNEMIKFLYSGKLDAELMHGSNYELIQKLLVASDRYGILSLNQLCETLLIQYLANENVISSLELAETYKCPKLKEATLYWIDSNKDPILITPEWKDFTLRNFDLAHEAMLFICNVVA